MRNEFLYSALSCASRQSIYGRTRYFESRDEIGSRLRSLVRSTTRISSVHADTREAPRDNDAHITAHLHLRAAFISVRETARALSRESTYAVGVCSPARRIARAKGRAALLSVEQKKKKGR